MKVLLTGFEPFGKHGINPSQELIRSLPDTLGDNIELIKTCLPVDQLIAPKKLLFQLHQHQPDVVLCFGLASGCSRFCLERVAINLMDFQIPDNVGAKISEASIILNGPTAYFTNLPINDLLSILLSENIPERISLSAGAFLCNLVFYRLLHEIEICHLSTKAGFFHLPLLFTCTNEKIAIVGRFEIETAEKSGAFDRVIPYDESFGPILVNEVERLKPQKIAINFSNNDPLADGLSHGMYLNLVEMLIGTPYAERIIPAEDLISALRGRKTLTEIQRIKSAIDSTLEFLRLPLPKLHPG